MVQDARPPIHYTAVKAEPEADAKDAAYHWIASPNLRVRLRENDRMPAALCGYQPARGSRWMVAQRTRQGACADCQATVTPLKRSDQVG